MFSTWETFIIISEMLIRMKTIISAISLIYNCHSLLWIDQKRTSFIAGLLRPFATSKKLLLPNSCSVKFKFTKKGGKKPREASGFSLWCKNCQGVTLGPAVVQFPTCTGTEFSCHYPHHCLCSGLHCCTVISAINKRKPFCGKKYYEEYSVLYF